ncbi:MAG TPA: LPS assembly protein LptD [Pyrinomonadaceae bacterium]|nr:LPS assembly protein LptD [Pyrinomonadaceae bacterium]
MRSSSPLNTTQARLARLALASPLIVLFLLSCAPGVFAQQTNPVDNQVTNPITDTPNVNPLTQELPVLTRPRVVGNKKPDAAQQTTDELKITARTQTATGLKGEKIFIYEGDVDARIGTYRLQADKITIYEATNKAVAEGNVVFDQEGEQRQRITGSRAEFNYATKLGYFENSTGFTNQTQDGTIIYYTADRVERVKLDTIVATNVEVTACEDIVPKWSFRAKRAEIKANDRIKLSTPSFRVKEIPVILLPYGSIPIKRRDRSSGFLTPTFSFSGNKGARLSTAYYQTLGRSADITLRNDLYSARGVGLGADVRTRANSRSFLNFGFFAVKDRIFGKKEGPDAPNQGGSSFYVNGVHYFPNGFLAAADVNITSNLAFRQIFSDTIQQAISPEERSQVFVNRNYSDYSFNFLARTQVTSIPNVRVRTRQLPSVSFEKRPSALSYFKKVPLYFSIGSSLDGVSRKETVEDLAAFQAEGNGNPIITPSVVQRLDVFPRFSLPLYRNGWSLTASAGARATYYSSSIDPATRLVLTRDVARGYGDFEVDLRPPALARNFYRGDNSFRVRHVIEPYLIYRRIAGINNFHRLILFDSTEAVAETNEFEYGVTNRFFTRRSPEQVAGGAAKNSATAFTSPEQATGDQATTATTPRKAAPSSQPYEILSVTMRAKYFFDPYFGGALIPGRRNQFYPINTFSGFTYGGVPRRFSPIAIETRVRPTVEWLADVRTDLDVQGGGFRNVSVTFGLNRPVVQAFQTFYYTRSISLAPSLRQFGGATGKEPGTLRGSQWSPSVFLGNRESGLFGGVSYFFDFQNRPGKGSSSLISSTTTIGYTFDCCAAAVQHYYFDVGLRRENRLLFTFRLNGIGTFGTEQIGQVFR